ncbi:Protein of unknown function (DUF3095) [Fragilaria crotonensis]|nr:Protein of unknown function (DUF3095) [Fragilaria crotonensis]
MTPTSKSLDTKSLPACVSLCLEEGMIMAEARLTGNSEDMQESMTRPSTSISLETLMCRWNTIPSQLGCVMTILVYDNPNVAGNVYDEVLAEIDAILNPSAHGRVRNAGNPVNTEGLQFKTFREILEYERRFYLSVWSFAFIARVAEILLSVIIFRLGYCKRVIVDGPHYKVSQRTYADFRKFDDMLRMVLDCTKDQARAIEFMLHDKHLHGLRLFYGVFHSSHSIMTCLVESATDGNHIHYMDGEGGGYAMAGKQLREQLREAEERDFRSGFEVHQPHFNNVVTDCDYTDLFGNLSPSMRHGSDDEEMGLVTMSGARHQNVSTNFEGHSALPQAKPADEGVSSHGFSEDEDRTQLVTTQNVTATAKKEKVKSTKKKKEKKDRRKSSTSTTITSSADFGISSQGGIWNPEQSVAVDIENNAYLAASCASSHTAPAEAKAKAPEKKKKKKKKKNKSDTDKGAQ